MLQKLQIYHQPIQTNPDHLESLTISYDDFDDAHNTYKQKIVLERNGVKYKIKRYINSLDAIRPMLESLDLAKYSSTGVKTGDAYYYVKYGDQFVATSDPDNIKELLDWAKFDEILGYDLSEYKKCD